MGIYSKDYVADPEALVLYAVTAACGFALLENVQYVVSSSLVSSEEEAAGIAMMRAILTVPLHAGTGCVIGAMLARRRFVGEKVAAERLGFCRIIAMPVLLHGTFDWVLFARPFEGADGLNSAVVPLLLVVLTWIIGRWQYVRIDSHPDVGRIPRYAPSLSCFPLHQPTEPAVLPLRPLQSEYSRTGGEGNRRPRPPARLPLRGRHLRPLRSSGYGDQHEQPADEARSGGGG